MGHSEVSEGRGKEAGLEGGWCPQSQESRHLHPSSLQFIPQCLVLRALGVSVPLQVFE